MGDTEEKESIDQAAKQSEDQPDTSLESEAKVEEGTEDQPGKQESEEPLYEVNGEKLTLEELQLGYMRNADYTKGKQEVAALKRQIESTRQEREDAGGNSGYTEQEKEALATLKKLGVTTRPDLEQAVAQVMNRIKMENEYSQVQKDSGLDDDMMFIAQGLSIRKNISLLEAVEKLGFKSGEKAVPRKSVSVQSNVSTTIKKGESKEITPEYIKSLDVTTPEGKKEFARVTAAIEKGEI